MDVHSLAWRTDLIFNRAEGEVVDRGDHLVVRTPDNQAHAWGNYLLFERPPAAGDHARWLALHHEAFADLPGIRHVILGWDGTEGAVGEVAPFLADGFELCRWVALTATEVHPPPHPNRGLVIRPLANEGEWEASLDNRVAAAGPGVDTSVLRTLRARKQVSYKRLEAAGLARWFGAFLGGELVGDLGLFVDGDLGRFQFVRTREDMHRRGIAGTLVFEAARYGLARLGARRLIIVADADSPAMRLYESVGFRAAERTAAVRRKRRPGS